MSYDITVGTQEFNYTYNVGRFFRDFGVHPYDDLEGQAPSEVAFRISAAFIRIAHWDYTELYEKYDSPNGWGDVEGAMKFLFSIYMACLTEEGVDKVDCH